MIRLFSGEKVAFFGNEDEYPMECPECGCRDELSWDVVATVSCGDSRPSMYWTAWKHSNARCLECDHESTIAEFMKQYNQEEE
jgi:hypothetical protein